MPTDFVNNSENQNSVEGLDLVYSRSYEQCEMMTAAEKNEYFDISFDMLNEVLTLPFFKNLKSTTLEYFDVFTKACDRLAQRLYTDITIDIVSDKKLAFVAIYKYSFELAFSEILLLYQILIAASNMDIHPPFDDEKNSCICFTFDFSDNHTNMLRAYSDNSLKNAFEI